MNRAQRRAAAKRRRPVTGPPNEGNRTATQRGITMPQNQERAQHFEKNTDDFKQEFQQRMMERVLGGGGQDASAGTDPDLLAVLRELRDNTGRIARALEGER